MGIFSNLSNLAGKVLEKFDNIANEDELKAVVSAAVLVAFADNEVTESEKDAGLNAITSHPSLSSFSRDKIKKYFDNDVKLMEADKQLASTVLESNLSGVKDMTARIRILGIAKQIASADGNTSQAEQQVIDRLRKITG